MCEVVAIHLESLENEIPALTAAMGAVLSEAAAVCLQDRGHTSPVRLHLERMGGPQILLHCSAVNDRMQRTHNDMQRATEHGACGVAILLIRKLHKLTVVEQSKKGTGFDYWLRPDDGDDALPFQNSARLEVSGILNGTASQFATRVKQKTEQMEVSDSTNLPAYAVVVEFGLPQAEVGKR